MSGLDYERAVLAAGPLGIMQACLDAVLPYVARAQAVRQGDRRLPAHAKGKIADIANIALNSARAYVYAVARACDAGQTTRFDAAGAILLASENAVRVSLEAIQALGGAGYPPQGLSGGALSARRQALRYRRRHQRDPPVPDRPGADGGVNAGAALALLLATVPAGRAQAEADCPSDEHVAHTAQLFFGRLEVGGSVSDTDWRAFLNEVVTPAFPDGFSDWDADGQWRDAKGVIVKEPSKVLLVVLPGRADDRDRLHDVVAAYKARFHQQSVLVVERRECAGF